MVIGITGYIGAGKSTVIDYIEKKYNFIVLKEDEMADSLVYPISELINKYSDLYNDKNEFLVVRNNIKNDIIKAFGDCVIDECGNVSKILIREQVSIFPNKIEYLNCIIHPQVLKMLERAINKNKTIFVESALPKEAGFYTLCDEVWLIKSSEDIRLNRVINTRNISMENAKIINDKQFIDEKKEKTIIIENMGTLEELQAKIDYLIKQIGL